MVPLLAIAGAGFLITLVLSRWVPYAVVAVVLGAVLSAGLTVGAFYYFFANDRDAATSQQISIFMTLALAFMGAIVARWVFDRRTASLVKTG